MSEGEMESEEEMEREEKETSEGESEDEEKGTSEGETEDEEKGTSEGETEDEEKDLRQRTTKRRTWTLRRKRVVPGEVKLRRDPLKKSITFIFTRKSIKEQAEALESVDDEVFALDLLRQPRGYSNYARLKAFAEAKATKQKNWKGVGRKYHAQDMGEKLSKAAKAYTELIDQASNPHNWTKAPRQGRVYHLPGIDYLAAEGAPEQSTVAETKHLTGVLDGAKQETRSLKEILKMTSSDSAKKVLAHHEPADERAQMVAVRSAERRAAAARDELQPDYIDEDEALEIAIRASLTEAMVSAREVLEDRQNRERIEKNHQAGASASQINDKGKWEEVEALQRSIKKSQAEPGALEATRYEEHHDQDVENMQEKIQSARRAKAAGKQKIDL